MKKATKSRQSAVRRPSKFLIGAIAGALIGSTGILMAPATAVYILIGLIVIAAYVFLTTRNTGVARQWSPRKLSAAPVMGALIIGVTAVAGVHYLGLSLAWHPEGQIKKTVQNVTQGGDPEDADDNASAVEANPGDILKYTIEVFNTADDADQHYNDLAYTMMTDDLPDGVELVSDPSKRKIEADLGTILPGESIAKTYEVKVTATDHGHVIKNTACFEADSVVRDNPQDGCDDAIIKVKIPSSPPPTTPPPTTPPPTTPPPTTPPPTTPPPTTPPPTTPPPTTPPPTTPPPTTPPPTTPPTPEPEPVSNELPNVGPRSMIVIVLFVIIVGYLFSALYGSKKKAKAIKFKAQ